LICSFSKKKKISRFFVDVSILSSKFDLISN